MPPVDPQTAARLEAMSRGGQRAAPAPQAPVVWTNPRQERAAQQSIENSEVSNAAALEAIRRGANADRRAERELQMREEKLAANSGFDSTEGQDRAAFHASNILRKSQIIRNTLAKYPDALQPGGGEFVAGTLGETPRRLVTKNTGRQSLVNAYRSIIESVIYLDTGAAASEEQIRNLSGEIIPEYGDDQDSLINKALSLQGRLDDAKMWSGPAEKRVGVPLDPAIKDNLIGNLDVRHLYALPPTINLEDYSGNVGPKALSTTNDVQDIPPAMQGEYEAWAKSRGGLKNVTAEEYADFRTRLDQKYFPNAAGVSVEAAKRFLESRERFQDAPAGQIPPPSRELGTAESVAAELSSSGPGIAGMNMANAGLLGIPEAFNKEAFDITREAHPNWAIAGDIAGAIAPMTAMEKIAAAGAVKLGRGAGVGTEALANMAYGGARGASGAEEGDSRLAGAAYGAGAGALGYGAGKVATSGVTPFVPRATQEALDELRKIGADPTTLQRVGLGRFEETFRALPVVRGALEKAEESVVRGNTEQALKHLTGVEGILARNTPAGAPPAPKLPTALPKELETGFETNTLLENTFKGEGGAYDALWKRVGGGFTPEFAQGTQALKVAAAKSPGIAKAYRKDLAPLVAGLMNKSGTYDGTTVQDTLLQLGQLKRDYLEMAQAATGGKPSDLRAAADLTGKLQKQIKSLVSQNQPEMGTALTKIDTGYRQMKTVFDASVRGRGTGGVPSTKQLLTSITKRDSSVDKDAVATNRAFGQKPITAATKVMGSREIPETAGLWPTMGAAGAASGVGYLSPALLGVVGTVGAAAYTPGLKRITQALLSGKREIPEGLGKIAGVPALSSKQTKIVNELIADPRTRAAIADYARQKLEGQ